MATPKASSSTSASRSDPKRKRTASPAAVGSSSAPAPSPIYFYEDGNVQLHVGSTLYKVHRSILSQAEVFRDTLLVGGAAGGSALVDGGRGADGELATIRLDDNQHDFDVFLRAMYDSLSFVRAAPTLGETRSLLRLADKYHHSAILTTAEDSFAKRVKSERSAFNSAPTDRFYDPAVFRVYIGLLSVSDEFNISEDACIWLHEALANQPLLVRPAMLFDECEVEGMTVSLSRKALLEIATRIDVRLNLLATLFGKMTRRIGHCDACDDEADEDDENRTQDHCEEGQLVICQQLEREIRRNEEERVDHILDALIEQSDEDGPMFSSNHHTAVNFDCLERGVRDHLKTMRSIFVRSLNVMLTR